MFPPLLHGLELLSLSDNNFRNHQGIVHVLINEDERERVKQNTTGKIKRKMFLGHLSHYYREAA